MGMDWSPATQAIGEIGKGCLMSEDVRISVVRDLIAEHTRSPSIKHIRDPYALTKLAQKVIRRLDGANAIWRKWNGSRETVLRSAVECWIPIEDMRAHLNSMTGPTLTTADVGQRLRTFQEEERTWPDDDIREGSLDLYEREKTQGTEMPAIIGMLQEYTEQEKERLRQEQQARYRAHVENERNALEQRFLSGADCKWTPVKGSTGVYCRTNGRVYRLLPTADKMWTLNRVDSVDDLEGAYIGKYRYRGDAGKALKQIAYQPERWRLT
jgi:hypothetical protein